MQIKNVDVDVDVGSISPEVHWTDDTDVVETFFHTLQSVHLIFPSDPDPPFNLPRFFHVILLLHFLDWLHVASCIRFKALMLAYKAQKMDEHHLLPHSTNHSTSLCPILRRCSTDPIIYRSTKKDLLQDSSLLSHCLYSNDGL